jgi:hypothetical protein
MKKLYYLLIIVLLIGSYTRAAIMPTDTLQSTTMPLTITQGKEKKLPFFKRLVFNKLMKKVHQQTTDKKPINEVGMVAFIIILIGVILFGILPFGARLALAALISIGGIIDLISFGANKGKRNPFGQAGCALIILFLIILLVFLGG